jgi:hypothetical protein
MFLHGAHSGVLCCAVLCCVVLCCVQDSALVLLSACQSELTAAQDQLAATSEELRHTQRQVNSHADISSAPLPVLCPQFSGTTLPKAWAAYVEQHGICIHNA